MLVISADSKGIVMRPEALRPQTARKAQAATTKLKTRLSTGELCGIAERIEAELVVEVGDPRRFTGTGGFARFNGTAPLPASSAEGDGEPVRHRLNRGGNRSSRPACTAWPSPSSDANHELGGHTKKEAMRILKRHLSGVVYRRMVRDLAARLESESFPANLEKPLDIGASDGVQSRRGPVLSRRVRKERQCPVS